MVNLFYEITISPQPPMQRPSMTRGARPQLFIKTSRFSFALAWLLLLALHAINLGYFGGVAILYKRIRQTNLGFQLDTYSIGLHSRHWGIVSGIHLAVAALHGVFLLSMVLGSLMSRRLVFHASIHWDCGYAESILADSMKKRVHRRVQDVHITDSSSSRLGPNLVRLMSKMLVHAGRSILSRDGFLGIGNVYFDHLHLAREVIETTLQTFQVYRMSYLLPRVWLIRVYVALLIANCWTTPILYRYYSDRHVYRRMMSLLCDAILDILSSIGVSMWIFATYLPQYTDPGFGFPYENWFDDVWFTDMQQQFQVMVVASWVDMASRLVFAFGVLQYMDAMKDILTPPSVSLQVSSQLSTRNEQPNIRMTAIVPSHSTSSKQSFSLKYLASRVCSQVLRLLHVGVPRLFVIWGIIILVVHSIAEFQYSVNADRPCKVRLLPWLVTKPVCSLVEISCSVSNLPGTMNTTWSTFEPRMTARLVIRHCNRLAVPNMIEQFTSLSGLKIYNSTIVSWPEEAALTHAAHPNLRIVLLLRCRLPNDQLPPGLLSSQFPPGVRSFVASASELSSLPANLHMIWPQGMSLAFERTSISAIPESVVQLNPMTLSFAGSPIERVPAEVFEMPVLECVLLSYTRIQELPRVVKNPSPLWYLFFLQGTNVSTFWSWMDPFINYSMWYQSEFFNAFDTPFCNELHLIANGSRSGFRIESSKMDVTDLASVMDASTPERLSRSRQAVACTPGTAFYFPLELEDAVHAL